ncbi:hypothetical protein At1D132_46020 (plasmid) [Agrobacterium fabrum]|nr:hypothetical protein At1D132_46020 [Agrobacterium fabrum]
MIEFPIKPVRLFALVRDGSLGLDVEAEIPTPICCLFIHEFPVHVLAGNGLIAGEIDADSKRLEWHEPCHEYVGDRFLTKVSSLMLISVQNSGSQEWEAMGEAA